MSEPELQNFTSLPPNEQREAIARLHADGWSEYGIAHATRLSVEYVREALAELHKLELTR